jgi:uncharacterized protein YigA (DUF484 family)
MSDRPLADANPISEEQVADYLRKNPDFFAHQPDLLMNLRLPHESGRAISLMEKQVAVLRERNMDMRHRLSDLLDNARANDRLFDKTKRLVLSLLECNELGDLVDALYYSFDKDFDIHYTRLILFSNRELSAGPARVEHIHTAREHIGKRIKGSRAVSGGIDLEETRFLFDTDADDIGSSAIAVLAHGNPLGVLAIGNRDPNYYRSSMGTLFLSYIAEVLNRLLPRLL